MIPDAKELVRELRTCQPDTTMCNFAADLIEEMIEEIERCEGALAEMKEAITELEWSISALVGEKV